MTRTWQAAVWVGLWCFWVLVSRSNHPTLLIDGIATGLLLTAFASAVYFNWLVLVPRLLHPGRSFAYWACLLLTMSVLTAADVAAIQKAYDVLWRPDPRRFSFRVNYVLDFAGMAVHLLAAAVTVGLFRRRRSSVTV